MKHSIWKFIKRFIIVVFSLWVIGLSALFVAGRWILPKTGKAFLISEIEKKIGYKDGNTIIII
ncbi:MAG: hypothetical protein P9M03_09360 [Candidatus Theseobacter exili]|nr:hypothetical protein [Candidatus Theseobacter exili]